MTTLGAVCEGLVIGWIVSGPGGWSRASARTVLLLGGSLALLGAEVVWLGGVSRSPWFLAGVLSSMWLGLTWRESLRSGLERNTKGES